MPTIPDVEIEAGAKALWKDTNPRWRGRTWDLLAEPYKDAWRTRARAVLTAARALQRRKTETGDGR